MKCIAVILPLAACICLWAGCSKTEEEHVPDDFEITAAIEGQWIKTHQIVRSYRDGVEVSASSSGFGYDLPVCKFTLPGEYFQWDSHNEQWSSGLHFVIADGYLIIDNFLHGIISFHEDNRTMVWVKERTDFGLLSRTETYFQRVNGE